LGYSGRTRFAGRAQRRISATIGHCSCSGHCQQRGCYQDETDQRLFHDAPLLGLGTLAEKHNYFGQPLSVLPFLLGLFTSAFPAAFDLEHVRLGPGFLF